MGESDGVNVSRNRVGEEADTGIDTVPLLTEGCLLDGVPETEE